MGTPTEPLKRNFATPPPKDVYELAGRALARVAMPATAAGLITLVIAAFAPNDAAVLAMYGGATTVAGLVGLGGASKLLKR